MVLTDITEDALQLLQAVEETRGRYGLNMPIDVVLGRRNAKVTKQGFDSLESYGRGKYKSEEHWKTIGRSLVQELLLDCHNSGGGKGFRGKGSSMTMSIYTVSKLGKRLLEGQGPRVMADLQAESTNMERERARRAARMAARRGNSQAAPTQESSPPPQRANRGRKQQAPPAAVSPRLVQTPPQVVQTAPQVLQTVPPPVQTSSQLVQAPGLRASATQPAWSAPAAATYRAEVPQTEPAAADEAGASPSWIAAKRRKLPASMDSPPPVASTAVVEHAAAAAVAQAAPPAAHSSALVPARQSTAGEGLKLAPCPGEIPGPSPLPRSLDAALMPFQRAGVAFAVRRQGRVLIGDDMGLGKTIQAIATCCAFRKDWPALIVVPNSVRLVWADELERWIPDLGPDGVNVVKTSQDLQELQKGVASFHIVTYGILARQSPVRDFLRESTAFGCLVVDESHMIKNRTAIRTKEVLHLARRSHRVLMLSGTPALARPLELYTQMEAVQPGLFASFSAFTSRYCNPKWTPFGMDFTGASNLEELHSYLRPIMVRRLKADVLEELPSKRRQRVQLEVDREGAATCAALREELEGTEFEEPKHKHQVLMQMYKETGQAKIGAVTEYVEDLLNGGCKFLVFGHHISMLDALEAVAVRNKAKFIRIDGSVASAERQRRVSLFQADDNVRVAILGLLAAGIGITLTAATTVVFAELHWTPGVLVQAEDRAHRIGQKSSVNIHYLIGVGTIDDLIWPAVSRKVEVVSTMCDGKKDSLRVRLSSKGRACGEALDGCSPLQLMDETAAEPEEGADMEELVAVVDGMTPRRQPRPMAESPASGEKKRARERPDQKKSAYSILSMLQGKPRARTEQGDCGAAAESEECSSSKAPGGHAAASKKASQTKAAGAAAGRAREEDQIESASEGEGPEASATQESLNYSFCVSRITNRVHILGADGRPLACNFKLADWEARRDAGPPLPEHLLSDAALVRATDTFLHEWVSLKLTEQRQLVDQPQRLPLSKALRQRKGRAAPSGRRVRPRAGGPFEGSEGQTASGTYDEKESGQAEGSKNSKDMRSYLLRAALTSNRTSEAGPDAEAAAEADAEDDAEDGAEDGAEDDAQGNAEGDAECDAQDQAEDPAPAAAATSKTALGIPASQAAVPGSLGFCPLLPEITLGEEDEEDGIEE